LANSEVDDRLHGEDANRRTLLAKAKQPGASFGFTLWLHLPLELRRGMG
jgi:hypothetical protein